MNPFDHTTDPDPENAVRYAENRMAPDEVRAYEAHLDGCAACRELLRAAGRVLPALDGALGPPPLGPGEAEALVARLNAAHPVRRRRGPRWAVRAAVAFAAAAAAAGLLLLRGASESPHATPRPRVRHAMDGGLR